MPGDAARTRRRILDAAAREFSEHGIAGARVDRIAVGSQSNKALIYKYFGSKGQLFDAVFDAVVVQTMRDVPIGADALPDYVVQLWDYHRVHPQPLRIGRWDALERGGTGMRLATVRAATREKIAVIEEGQRQGTVSDALPAGTLLDLLIALSQSGLDAPKTGAASQNRRAALQQAAHSLVDPQINRQTIRDQ